MRTIHLRLLAVGLAAATLSACGGGETSTGTVTPPVVVPPAARFEDQFGTNFGVAYRNAPNTDATDPVASDIVPLSLTTEAVTA